MEEVLDFYEEPADPARPRVCVDELPYHLLEDKVPPVAGEPGRPPREDYTYTQRATCNIFGIFQFETGWRHFAVTDRRTTDDFANLLKDLVDVYFPDATVIRLVTDNLNTHGPHALYATFPAEEAHRIARKLDWHYTPVHGSWLNMVEIELGLLKSHCLKRRLPTVQRVQEEAAAWEAERNAAHATVHWHFTTPQARKTLRRLYPVKPDKISVAE